MALVTVSETVKNFSNGKFRTTRNHARQNFGRDIATSVFLNGNTAILEKACYTGRRSNWNRQKSIKEMTAKISSVADLVDESMREISNFRFLQSSKLKNRIADIWQ